MVHELVNWLRLHIALHFYHSKFMEQGTSHEQEKPPGIQWLHLMMLTQFMHEQKGWPHTTLLNEQLWVYQLLRTSEFHEFSLLMHYIIFLITYQEVRNGQKFTQRRNSCVISCSHEQCIDYNGNIYCCTNLKPNLAESHRSCKNFEISCKKIAAIRSYHGYDWSA